MTNQYMVLTLGRDLLYAGIKATASSLSQLQSYVKEQNIAVDGNDSVVFYKLRNKTLTPICLGVSLEDPSQKEGLSLLDTENPMDIPGYFPIPPGKYGFVQLQSNADSVIENEHKELLDYLEEKQAIADTETFFIRTISEDSGEAYQILIPIKEQT